MIRLLAQWFRRGLRRAQAPQAGMFNLPESVAYSAFLASGVEGVNEVSFAQFLASMRDASPKCFARHAGRAEPVPEPVRFAS